jgi:predicted GNAT superfamily acetyltransferase
MDPQLPKPDQLGSIIALAEKALGSDRAQRFVRAHLLEHHLLVVSHNDDVTGFIAYRTDWFQCTFISLVIVRDDQRRRGIARALFRAVEDASPSPRLFSSAEETNAISIRMHAALGFAPSGHIDNLPQGYRELLFYKRIR